MNIVALWNTPKTILPKRLITVRLVSLGFFVFFQCLIFKYSY